MDKEEVEKLRLELIMGVVERGDANGVDAKQFNPGTILFHEAVDRAFVQCDSWGYVLHHMAILSNEDLFWKASVIDKLMQDFYTELSELHFQ